MFRMLAGAAVALMIGVNGATAQTTIKVASFTPPVSVAVKAVFEPWMRAVEGELGNEVAFQPYWGGTLGRDATKQLKLMMDGIADVAFIAPEYTKGRFPDTSVLDLPMMVDDALEGSVAHWRLYQQSLLRGYDGFKVITLYTTGPVAIHSRVPVKDMKDLAGLKLRASGGEQVAVIKLLGATPVALAANQMAEALSRKTIDAALIAFGGIPTFKLDQVTSYHVDARLGVTANMIAMNEAAWSRLSPKAQAAFMKFGAEPLSRRAGRAMVKSDSDSLHAVEKPPHQVVVPTAAQAAQWRKTYEPIYREWIAGNDQGQKTFDGMQRILAEFRAGR